MCGHSQQQQVKTQLTAVPTYSWQSERALHLKKPSGCFMQAAAQCCNILIEMLLKPARGQMLISDGIPMEHDDTNGTQDAHKSTSDPICATSRDATQMQRSLTKQRSNVYMCAPSAYRVWCVYMCDAWECLHIIYVWACLQRPGWSVRHRRNGGGTHGRARLLLCICVCIRVSVGPHITSLGWQTGARFSWQKRNISR